MCVWTDGYLGQTDEGEARPGADRQLPATTRAVGGLRDAGRLVDGREHATTETRRTHDGKARLSRRGHRKEATHTKGPTGGRLGREHPTLRGGMMAKVNLEELDEGLRRLAGVVRAQPERDRPPKLRADTEISMVNVFISAKYALALTQKLPNQSAKH